MIPPKEEGVIRLDAFSAPELRATRAGFGDQVFALAENHARLVVLCADLEPSLHVSNFRKHFPDRFFEFGVAEQNMVTAAVGMSFTGLVPWVGTFASFVPFRTLDQIRINLGYSAANVKLASSHAGLLTGEDGATHQALEDIAVMRSIPNMTVVVPCDYEETRKAVSALSSLDGPCYLRLSRAKLPVITSKSAPFEVGKILELKSGRDVTLIACGSMVYPSLQAAHDLEKEGISVQVINCHTIKPLDKVGLLSAIKGTYAVVVAEEAQSNGGLGGAVSELIVKNYPCHMEHVAVQDTFGESGRASELMHKYGLTRDRIAESCRVVMKRKQQEF